MVVNAFILWSLKSPIRLNLQNTVLSTIISTSYDVYLVHMISLSALLYYFEDVPIILFIGLTYIVSFSFYKLRNLFLFR